MNNPLTPILHPAFYHGHGKGAPFFEGWYYKLVSHDENQRYAVIPGIQLGEKSHAFIQVLDGATGWSSYHSFPTEQFWASKTDFQIQIGANCFNLKGFELNIQDEIATITGKVEILDPQPWPVTLLSPGIMGWYAWIPRMECYHGVLSFDHALRGVLTLNGGKLDFNSGRGYIEKDWGQAFPAAWVWYQTNHFEQSGTCLTASIAIIPWLGNAFPGFIIGLWHNRTLYRFATYTGAKTRRLIIEDDHVEWEVSDRNYRLNMRAERSVGGLLLGPTRQDMGKRVNETLNARVQVSLSSHGNGLIFQGQGRHAGLEVHGDLPRLLKLQLAGKE